MSLIRTKKNQGLGTAFLKDFTSLCDARNISIELEVYENDSITQTRLENYYSRFGFVDMENGIMARMPEISPQP